LLLSLAAVFLLLSMKGRKNISSRISDADRMIERNGVISSFLLFHKSVKKTNRETRDRNRYLQSLFLFLVLQFYDIGLRNARLN